MKYRPGDLVQIKDKSNASPSGAEPLHPRFFGKLCLITGINSYEDSYIAVCCETGEELGLYDEELDFLN